MSATRNIEVPLNRVEGDLEIRVELDGHTVTRAWSKGTLYRGFENMIRGRAARDALVVMPRICGICGTSHLYAATLVLEKIIGLRPPADAVRLRNVSLLAEQVQNDLRQAFLMFTPDLTNPAFAAHPDYAEAQERYAPFEGRSVHSVIECSRLPVEVIAILGGQWPHSSYMVPGGLATVPSVIDRLKCRQLLEQCLRHYERRILGCSVERWNDVQSLADLEQWLEETPSHRNSDVGFLLRFGRDIGLERLGEGVDTFLSFGSCPSPEGDGAFVPSGIVSGQVRQPFEQRHITEQVASSWFRPYEGGLHPSEGKTEPQYNASDERRYTWAKAPRYEGQPAETGAFAESLVAGHPLFTDWLAQRGANVLARVIARVVRPALVLPQMIAWLNESVGSDHFYQNPGALFDGEGAGLLHAARGALGHWARVKNNKIEHYQVITPTAWNGSPRDEKGVCGPWETALANTEIKDPENPIELGMIVRSFDPCLVCTVHTYRPNGQPLGEYRLGMKGTR